MRSYKEQVLEKEKTTLRHLQAERAKIEMDIENLENHRKSREEVKSCILVLGEKKGVECFYTLINPHPVEI